MKTKSSFSHKALDNWLEHNHGTSFKFSRRKNGVDVEMDDVPCVFTAVDLLGRHENAFIDPSKLFAVLTEYSAGCTVSIIGTKVLVKVDSITEFRANPTHVLAKFDATADVLEKFRTLSKEIGHKKEIA